MKKPIDHSEPTVLWAILAKDGERVLKLYLECLLSQDFPLSKIFLYIRTNDNNDSTSEILKKFLTDHGKKFLGHYYDDTSLNPEIRKYGIHEWNFLRLKIMAQIRQESLDYAREGNFDFYFVSDVDNFIIPPTLKSLISLNISVVAPLLKMVIPATPTKYENIYYSTFHEKIDPERGEFIMTNRLKQIATGEAKGLFEVDLIHCTYLLRRDVFEKVDYLFQDDNYEYRNFALSLRESSIPQFIDATRYYGCLTLSEAVHDCRSSLLEIIQNSPAEKEILKPYHSNHDLRMIGLTIEKNVMRRAEFESRHLGLRYEWFYGLDAAQLDRGKLIDDGLLTPQCDWDSATIANAIGHRELWKECIRTDQNIVIFEDDARFVRDFYPALSSLYTQIPQDFELLMLGFNWDSFVFIDLFESPSGTIKIIFSQEKLQRDLDFIQHNMFSPKAHRLRALFGLPAYLISPKGAFKLLNSVFPLEDRLVSPKNVPWRLSSKTIDALLNEFYERSKSFVSIPPIVYVSNDVASSTRLGQK
jgi:GR25 family glycosyltransferase involved in LPS biosynthesis